MGWESVLGHAAHVTRFRQIIQQHRLAHGYLFVGPSGCGKRTFAVQMAQCLLCTGNPDTKFEACGQCSGCKQVLAESHPDLYQLGLPEGKREVPIELFRGERGTRSGLCYELSRTPMAGGRKIAIIDDVNRLTEESANALLKTLEEPPTRSLLILLASNLDGILSTIRSRCQTVRFDPLSEADVVELLVRHEMVEDTEQAARIAPLCEGSLDLAAELLHSQLQQMRQVLYDGLATEGFRSHQLAAQLLELVVASGEPADQRRAALWLIRFTVEFYRESIGILATGKTPKAASPQTVRFASRLSPSLDLSDGTGREQSGAGNLRLGGQSEAGNLRLPEVLEGIGALIERTIQAETQLDRNTGVPICLEVLFFELGVLSRNLPTEVTSA